MATFISQPLPVRIDDVEGVEEIEDRLIEYLQNELAEFALLKHEEPKVKSVYEMSFEEYMELPGNVRL